MQLDTVADAMPMVRRHGTKVPAPMAADSKPPHHEDVLAFLSAPGTFGPGRAERTDTHISHVFLHGDRAFKLKRPVNTGFLDFSTPEARRRACRHELEVNRRIAGDLYRGIRTLTKEPHGLALDGPGRAVDWLVEMVRFNAEEQFDVLARRGRLTEAMITALARRLARIHAEAPRRPDCGGIREMRMLAADTVSGLTGFANRLGGMRPLAALARRLRQELDACGPLLEARRRFGCVRHCHADLHLANICLFRGAPTPFDAIEFDDRMASIDIVYDMAFTVMDLMAFGLDDLANRFLNGWLESARDYPGLRLLPFFMALRAAIRARVLFLTALAGDAGRGALSADSARGYFRLAGRVIRRPRPVLLAVGGLSGTGKSTIARRLALDIAPAPGAVILRSDVIRKRIFGRTPEERLPQDAYRPEVSARVFTAMFRDARRALAAGQPVILDATFMDEALRDHAALLAGREGVPFRGLWLEAPDSVLIPRIGARRGDASDATAEVLARQREAGAGLVGWMRVDASGPADRAHRQARGLLAKPGGKLLTAP